MGAKYRVEYKDYFQNNWVVEISNDSYTGGLIYLRGVGTKACEIVRDCDDDPYTTIVNTKANINVYQSEDLPIDILELQTAQDKDFTVVVKVNDIYQFYGYLIPDGIQQSFQSAPFELNLNATDGLMLLDTIPYTHANLPGGRVIINYFRQILFNNPNLGLPLPIKWVNKLVNDAFPSEDDVFSGSILWSSRGEGFTDYQGNNKSCLYILQGILKSMQCRIVQAEGYWVIWRINDIVSGNFSFRSISTDQSGYIINPATPSNVNATLNSVDRKIVMEDAIITILPALKSIKTTYTQDERDNVLPNGNMDLTSLGAPLYWGFNSGTSASLETAPSLSNNYGNSVKVTNLAGQPEATFQLIDGELPIDTDTLYTYINFGYKFLIHQGASVNSDGIIQWGSTPNSFMLRYNDGVDFWYMNENGFWTKQVTTVDVYVDNLKLDDVAQIDFNAKQNIILPLPAVSPIGRTATPSLYVGFFIPAGRVQYFDDIYINVENNNDVYDGVISSSKNTATESYDLTISSAHSGFYVSNLMTDFSRSGVEKFYSDQHIQAATLTEMNTHSVLRSRYKPSLILDCSLYGNNYKYDEIYNISQFPGKKFLPLKSTWNTETNVTNLTMVEVRNDSLTVDMKHYGSNDKTNLSN